MRGINITGISAKNTGKAKGRLPIGTLFFTGFIAGILIMYFGKSVLLESTGLLDENTFVDMKYMTVDGSALFYYVLKKRMGSALILTILSTTYLGLLICTIFSIWYGAISGAFMSALIIRYGIKGLFLAVVSIFPQYILYFPAFAALLILCSELNRKIYFQKYGYQGVEGRAKLISGKLIVFLVIIAVIFVGCVLESFCNPKILLSFLKIF